MTNFCIHLLKLIFFFENFIQTYNISWTHPIILLPSNFLPNPSKASPYLLHACPIFLILNIWIPWVHRDAHMPLVVGSYTVIWGRRAVTIPPKKRSYPYCSSHQLPSSTLLSNLLDLCAVFLFKTDLILCRWPQLLFISSCVQHSCYVQKTFHSNPT